MDSAALLDLLGNENRRRILRLLARRPCYVTEISEYLGVSPKAVIDHLRKLEEAGVVESRVDDRQRKYFHIARNIRLEINVSPYGFGTKSAYPASRNLDIASFSYLSVDLNISEQNNPQRLSRELHRLEELENELSMLQRWVQGRIAEAHEKLADKVGGQDEDDRRLRAELMVALADGPKSVPELAEETDLPPPIVEDILMTLADQELVTRDNQRWALTG